MNKNTTVNILTGILLALASTGAMAQTALQQLGAEAGNDTVALARDFQALRASNAGPAPVSIRRASKDVFSGCESFNAKAFMAWNLPQAALIVQTCLNNAYPADGSYTVQSSVARFGIRSCASKGIAACGSIMEVSGIKITINGGVLAGDSVLQDLNDSIEQRGGKLLGFFATIDSSGAQILN